MEYDPKHMPQMLMDLDRLLNDVGTLIGVIAGESEDERGYSDAEAVAIAATNHQMVLGRIETYNRPPGE